MNTPAPSLSPDQADAWDALAEAFGASGIDLIAEELQPPQPGKGRVMAVIGKAGSGKTLLLSQITKALREAGVEVVGQGRGHGDGPHGMAPQVFRDFASGLRSDYRGTLDRFIALEAFGSDDARGELRTLRAEVFARGEPATRVLVDGLGLLESVDLRKTLPGLQVPSLWLAGRRDRLVDPRAMHDAAGRTPAAAAVTLDHAGHAPFLTHADAVVEQLRAFLPDATAAVADGPDVRTLPQ